jgi:hypothetical protein
MFSTIFRRPLNTVRMALATFEKYGMIEIYNGVVTIPNWGKHQNLDQIEAKKEYMRNYMTTYRQKQLSKTNSKTNSKSNVRQADKDIDKEVEGEENNNADKPPKVLSELEKAVADFEEMRKKIRKPLTPRAKEIMLKKLKELAKDEKTQIAILEQSIMNSWQGVFPLKDEQRRNAEHPYRRVDHNGNIFLREDV